MLPKRSIAVVVLRAWRCRGILLRISILWDCFAALTPPTSTSVTVAEAMGCHQTDLKDVDGVSKCIERLSGDKLNRVWQN